MMLHLGNCLDVLASLPAESVDSCVTDPPYHLTSIVKRFGADNAAPAKSGATGVYKRHSTGFMGKKWDGGDIAFKLDTWAEVLRVLKPGGHMLCMGGTRTYHRMVCAVEDAGFEIRDQIGWLYGSGFPKSHNLDGEWQGWGTALKPAWEPIALTRKPLIGTVAANVLVHGTGALNIDGCRVTSSGGKLRKDEPSQERRYIDHGVTNFAATPGPRNGSPSGRWPANVIHDGSDEVLNAFPDAKGQQGYVGPEHGDRPSRGIYGDFGPRPPNSPRGDSGTAARFFYCAKTTKKERNAGCGALPLKTGGMRSETSGQHITRRDGNDPKPIHNNHPTVKPIALMRYLCRLVTPPNGLVIDPFMGSGSTGIAADAEGFRFIGIESDSGYMDIACARLVHWTKRTPNISAGVLLA